MLKETFFLQTKEDDNDPCKSSQFSVVIANARGIYGLYSYREVFEFNQFRGIGSWRGFALGAMYAGCEFDKNSAGPVDIFTIKLKT
jgi:ATP-dependent HslUV protease, peptidase subunit HslV